MLLLQFGVVICDYRPSSYRFLICCSLCSWYLFSAALNAVPDPLGPPSYILAPPPQIYTGYRLDPTGDRGKNNELLVMAPAPRQQLRSAGEHTASLAGTHLAQWPASCPEPPLVHSKLPGALSCGGTRCWHRASGGEHGTRPFKHQPASLHKHAPRGEKAVARPAGGGGGGRVPPR